MLIPLTQLPPIHFQATLVQCSQLPRHHHAQVNCVRTSSFLGRDHSEALRLRPRLLLTACLSFRASACLRVDMPTLSAHVVLDPEIPLASSLSVISSHGSALFHAIILLPLSGRQQPFLTPPWFPSIFTDCRRESRIAQSRVCGCGLTRNSKCDPVLLSISRQE